MVFNIQPFPKKVKGLTEEEKSIAVKMLEEGYNEQQICAFLNIGREGVFNQGRVARKVLLNSNIQAASDKDLSKFIKVKKSYDLKTGLNPYVHPRVMRAREAMISAVRGYNDPNMIFKNEHFCVLANIAWTYLVHDYLESLGVEINDEAGRAISLSRLLKKESCPIENKGVIENLNQIIDIRNRVEHTYYEDYKNRLGNLFQACCLNFEMYLTDWYGAQVSIANQVGLALQFCNIDEEQLSTLESYNLPPRLEAMYRNLDAVESGLGSDKEFFTLRVYYTQEATSKTKAHIERLISSSDESADSKTVIKKVTKKKVSEKEIIKIITDEGYSLFSSFYHQKFWKTKWTNAKIRNKKAIRYGEVIYKTNWLWYEEEWLPEVREHCKKNISFYTGKCFKSPF